MQTFRIIQPTPALKPFIRYYWILQDSTSGIVTQRTLPTGCMSLVFHRGERLKVTNRDELQPQSFICGQESGYSDVTSTGDIEMIVVVFQPHAAKIFFRMPVTLLRDRNVAIEDIENTALRDLAHKVEDSENYDTSIALIEDYFYKCLLYGTNYHLPRLAAFSASIEDRQPLKESIASTTFFISYRINHSKYIEKREVCVPLQPIFSGTSLKNRYYGTESGTTRRKNYILHFNRIESLTLPQ